MTDYNTLSDCEINRRVELAIYGDPKTDFDRFFADMPPPDYCNSPEDAWTVIEQIWDELQKPMYDACSQFDETKWDAIQSVYLCGPIKAAMICFLMMKEAENAGNEV